MSYHVQLLKQFCCLVMLEQFHLARMAKHVLMSLSSFLHQEYRVCLTLRNDGHLLQNLRQFLPLMEEEYRKNDARCVLVRRRIFQLFLFCSNLVIYHSDVRSSAMI